MERKFYHYLIAQYSIVLMPPALAAASFEVNPYTSSFLEEYVGYLAGISGLILQLILYPFLHNELWIGCFLLAAKVFSLYPFFVIMYLKIRRYKWLPILVNAVLSIWGILVGLLWMTAAMQ
ncbi:hypothetical protein ACFFSY_30435 [Paenibacillus aurantiacus]|uniref:Integral membrane protein n=1 Tax=Paenibacillus aurantiacus TaxID=1936118 RepID=A0ABV5KYI0_9BACL